MKNTSLKRQAENITGIIDELIDEVNDLEDKIKNLESELEKRDKQILDLQDDIAMLEEYSNEL